ncbi:MAG: TetR/AcrR family transcriptional regulator [Rhodospirillales bacterium]
MKTARKGKSAVKEACLSEALKIIAESGVETLSLREVARRLGLSHQAPYKHFASRDHILAGLVERLYQEFAAYLDDRPEATDPFVDLGNMGARYLEYASERPLEYRLLFNTALPSAQDHPLMMTEARHAFDLLQTRLSHMLLRPLSEEGAKDSRADAFFIWSTLHGAASLLQSDALRLLEFGSDERERLIQRVFARIGAAINPA